MSLSDPTPLALVAVAITVAAPVSAAVLRIVRLPSALDTWYRTGLRWASINFCFWACSSVSYSLASMFAAESHGMVVVVAMGIAIVTALPAFVLIPIGLYYSLTRWRLRPIQAFWVLTILFGVALEWVRSEPWLLALAMAYSLVAGAVAVYGLIVSQRSTHDLLTSDTSDQTP